MADKNPNLGMIPALSTRRPTPRAFKESSLAQAVASKLVPERDRGQFRTRTHEGVESPDGGWLGQISNMTAGSVNDSSNLYQLLPDTELAQKVLVSSILSPKDMVSTELNFSLAENVVEGDIGGALLRVVEDYFDRVYKIKPQMSTMLREILFTKGSFPLMILPESSIDAAINSDQRVSLESISDEVTPQGVHKSIGFLGRADRKNTTWSLESLTGGEIGVLSDDDCKVRLKGVNDIRLTVIDNPLALKMPLLMDKLRQDRVQDVLASRGLAEVTRVTPLPTPGPGLETVYQGTAPSSVGASVQGFDQELSSFYRPRKNKHTPVKAILTPEQTGNDNIGHPMVMKLPPECVIPVHTPGNPEDHLGYFILLDQNGHFLNKSSQANHYNDLAYNMGAGKELSSQLINSVRRGTEGRETEPSKVNVDQAVRVYAQLVETDLVNRLKNGLMGESVEIARPLDVYRIMLSRAFANEETQVLYVPASLVTYMAFSFTDFGVGKSLLEDNKILASIRAILLFANTMQSVKASVGRTSVKINLDPRDPDPSSTVEFLMHEYAKNRQSAYPLGASSPRDIVNFLQNAGIDLQVTGNNGYAETSMDVEANNREYTKPDTDLEDSLKKRYLMSLGLSPETVDATYSPDFATSVVANNLLLTKQVIDYQDKFIPFLEDFVRKYIVNSGFLMNRLRTTLDNAKVKITQSGREVSPDQFLKRFIGAINVSLPRPDMASLKNQMEAFDDYSSGLDKAIDAYIDSSFMGSTELGDVDGMLDNFKAAIKSHYLRQWLRDNNVFAELLDLVSFTKDEQPVLKIAERHAEHCEAMAATLEGLADRFAVQAKAQADRKAEFEKQNDVTVTTDGSGGGDDSGGDDLGGGDDFGGDEDEFGGDDDLGGDSDLDAGLDEKPDDTPPPDDEAIQDDEEEKEDEDDDLKPDTEGHITDSPIIQPK